MKTSATAAVIVVFVALAILTSACTSESITGKLVKESGTGLEADANNSSAGDGNVNGNGDADFCNLGLGVLKENSPKL